MSFVIYNTNRYSLWRGNSYSAKSYATERAAKAQLTKLTKGPSPHLQKGEWAVASVSDFRAMEPKVEVTSLMGGDVLIRASDRGNPALDPSMEGYYCM